MKIGEIKELIDDGSIDIEQYNWKINDGNISIEEKTTQEILSTLDLNNNKVLSKKVLKYLGIKKYIDNIKS